MISEAVINTLIIAIGSIVTGYIALRLKNAKPKTDRVDTAFDMYDKMLARKDEEISRLNDENDELRKERNKK